MKAHIKTLLILLALSALVILLIFLYAKGPMLDTYKNLEKEKMETIVRQANDRLVSEYEHLDQTAVDYSTWDDMYNYAKAPDAEFEKSGIGIYTHEANHFDVVMVFNSSYSPVLTRFYDHTDKKILPLPDGIAELMTKDKLLKFTSEGLDHFGNANVENHTDLDGFIYLKQGPMIIAVESIFDSQGNGPSTGWLFIGRFLDETEISELGEELKYSIKIHEIGSEDGHPNHKIAEKELLEKKSASYILEVNDSMIEGYSTINDVFGEPKYLLEVQNDRSIFQYGRKNINDFIYILIIVIIGFVLLAGFLVDEFFLKRISRLETQLEVISKTGDIKTRVEVASDDEITDVSISVNSMLDRLSKTSTEIRENEEKFKNVFESSQDAIMTLEPPTWKFTSANAATVKLFGAKNSDEFTNLGPWDVSPLLQPNGQPSGEMAKNAIMKAMTEGKNFFEWTHKKLDGTEFSATVLLSRFNWGGKDLLQATVRDISKIKAAELKLKESEERLNYSITSANAVTFDWDMINDKVIFSDNFSSVYKGIDQNFVGSFKNYLKYVDPMEREKMQLGIQNAISRNEKYDDIHSILLPDGKKITLSTKASVKTRNGSPIGMAGILMDVTEKIKMNDQMSLLSSALQSAENAIVITDIYGKIQYVNPSFTKLTGYSSEEAIGANPRILKSGKQDLAFYKNLWDTINSGKTWSGEIINSYKGGRGGIEQMTITPILEKDGSVSHFIAIKEDITKRKELEDKLSESQTLFRGMYEQSPLGISFYGNDGLLKSMNKATLLLLGIESVEDSRMKSIFNLPAQTPEEVRQLKAGINLEKIVELDFDMLKSMGLLNTRKTGKRTINTTAVPLLSTEKQAPLGYLMIFEDITERATIIENMENSNQELKRLDKVKTEFLNMVSHELKTPITAISAHIDVIDDYKDKVDPQVLKSMNAIRRNKEQLRILIENILEISRVESGRFEMNYTDVNVKDVIEGVIEDIRLLAEEKQIFLKSEISDIPTIEGDEIRLKEIITNLTTNAIKFTETGGVTITAERKGEFVEVSVIDTGIGIPEDKVGNLFQKFYQVDASVDRKYGGSGLGLSICKMLVEMHGGKIEVDSVFGKGTVFSFKLPIRKKETIKGMEK
ncbi:PAS domain S-box protein [Candidatus Micrarchaeota archaeon]|nr:PAS domain S-box protein [Candidatus Micrarchaeota archaeon]